MMVESPAFAAQLQAPELLGIEIRCQCLQGTPTGGAAIATGPGLVSYIGRGFGFFLSDPGTTPGLNGEIETLRAVLLITVITGGSGESHRAANGQPALDSSSIRVAYLPPRTTFRGLVQDNGVRSVTVVLDPDVLDQNLDLSLLDLPGAIQQLIRSSTSAYTTHPISNSVQRIAEEALEHVPEASPLGWLFYRMKALQLLWAVVERLAAEDRGAAHTGPNERELSSVEKVRAMLQNSPAQDYPIECLARVAAMNRTKLRSLFKEIHGQTISQFRTEVRMKRGRELLHQTRLSVAEISFDLGYADASSFIVAFKKFFGFNPGWIRSGRRPAQAPLDADMACEAVC